MLEMLRTWLNGAREYNAGVLLYEQCDHSADLLEMFKKGINDFRKRRLQEELLIICKKLKGEQKNTERDILRATDSRENTGGIIPTNIGSDTDSDSQGLLRKGGEILRPCGRQDVSTNIPPVNAALFNAAKLVADKRFKQVMNERAVLFSMIDNNSLEDPNTAERISARCKMAINVVRGYQAVSKLYDDAEFVKANGKLPYADDSAGGEYDNLPDDLVKQKLDNLRKNYNKIKDREQTPERIALLQKHKSNIEKLEARWRLLKSQV